MSNDQQQDARSYRSTAGESGQVAIGTLIIFIATLLIAAITVGVLFDIAGVLESRSEAASDESSSQLTDRLEIVTITGTNITEANDGTREIREIDVIISGSESGGNVNLYNITAQWIGPDGSYTLINEDIANDSTDGTFRTVVYSDDDDSFPVLTSPDDRFALRFEPGWKFGQSGLSEGETVEVSLTTESGSSSVLHISVPQSLSGRSAISL